MEKSETRPLRMFKSIGASPFSPRGRLKSKFRLLVEESVNLNLGIPRESKRIWRSSKMATFDRSVMVVYIIICTLLSICTVILVSANKYSQIPNLGLQLEDNVNVESKLIKSPLEDKLSVYKLNIFPSLIDDFTNEPSKLFRRAITLSTSNEDREEQFADNIDRQKNVEESNEKPIEESSSSSSSSLSSANGNNQQVNLEQQVDQRRQTLTKLKQKYMTNRAINDRAYYILLFIYSLFILFGTISNSLICLTVILKPKILSPRNIFIVNLAGSDLLLCVFTIPFTFIELSNKMWHMGLLPCKLVAGLQATSIFVSTISITAIALDRYRVIVYPTHQESTNNNTRSAVLLLALVWFVALLLSLPLFNFRTVEHIDLPLSNDDFKSIDFCVEAWPFEHGRGIYSVISMIFQYVLPITIVSVVYAKISDKLQKRLIRRQRLTQLECQQKKQLNLIKRTHTMLVSVSLIFGLSWLPLNLLNLIGDFSELFRGNDQTFRIVFAICHLIGCSSALSNPILYGYLNENFRKEFRQVYSQHAHYLLRFARRHLFLRFFCCGRKLNMSNYIESSSSSSSSSIYSTTSSGSSSSSNSSLDSCNSKSAAIGHSNSSKSSSNSRRSIIEDLEAGQRLLDKKRKTSGEHELCSLITNSNSKQLNKSISRESQADLEREGTTNELSKIGLKSNENPEQALRKFSIQTLTSSRQKLDRGMRFCLCLSTINSSTESLQTNAGGQVKQSFSRRSYNLRHSSVIVDESYGRNKRDKSSLKGKRKSKVTKMELQNMSKHQENQINRSTTEATRLKRKKMKKNKRNKCKCECYRCNKIEDGIKPVESKEIKKESDKKTSITIENQNQKQQQPGRHVWLRFFSSSERMDNKTNQLTTKKTNNTTNDSTKQENLADKHNGKEELKLIKESTKSRHCSNCRRTSSRKSRERKDTVRGSSQLRNGAEGAIKRRKEGFYSGTTKQIVNSLGQNTSTAEKKCLHANSSTGSHSKGLTQGIILTSNKESDEGEIEDEDDEELRKSGSSSSKKEKSKLTGKYYLSVETARRKQSLDQTSTSRERTSTSVVFMNFNELEVTHAIATPAISGNADLGGSLSKSEELSGNNEQLSGGLAKTAVDFDASGSARPPSGTGKVTRKEIDLKAMKINLELEKSLVLGNGDSDNVAGGNSAEVSGSSGVTPASVWHEVNECSDPIDPIGACLIVENCHQQNGKSSLASGQREKTTIEHQIETKRCCSVGSRYGDHYRDHSDIKRLDSAGVLSSSECKWQGRELNQQAGVQQRSQTNENNSNPSSYMCLGSHSSSCSCSLSHSSATSSLSCQFNDNNHADDNDDEDDDDGCIYTATNIKSSKHPNSSSTTDSRSTQTVASCSLTNNLDDFLNQLSSTSLSANNPATGSCPQTNRNKARRLPSSGTNNVQQTTLNTALVATTTTTNATTCSLTSSSHTNTATTTSSSRRSSLNSEFACSSSTGAPPSSPSSLQKSSTSLGAIRETCEKRSFQQSQTIKNNNLPSSNPSASTTRKLSSTATGEDISVNINDELVCGLIPHKQQNGVPDFQSKSNILRSKNEADISSSLIDNSQQQQQQQQQQ